MADHGEGDTLATALDSRRGWVDPESALSYSMVQSIFVPLCIC